MILLTIYLLFAAGALVLLALSLLVSAVTGWALDPATVATGLWIGFTLILCFGRREGRTA